MEGFIGDVLKKIKELTEPAEIGLSPTEKNIKDFFEKAWKEKRKYTNYKMLMFDQDTERNTWTEMYYNPELEQDLKPIPNLRLRVRQRAYGIKPTEVVETEFVFVPKLKSLVVRSSIFDFNEEKYTTNMRIDDLKALSFDDKDRIFSSPSQSEDKKSPFTIHEAREFAKRAYVIGYSLYTQKKLPPDFHHSFPVQSVGKK